MGITHQHHYHTREFSLFLSFFLEIKNQKKKTKSRLGLFLISFLCSVVRGSQGGGENYHLIDLFLS